MTVVVKNQGGAVGADFVVRHAVDDQNDGAKEKSVTALNPGSQTGITFDDMRLGKGQHKLAATADSKNSANESNKGNNETVIAVQCKDEGD